MWHEFGGLSPFPALYITKKHFYHWLFWPPLIVVSAEKLMTEWSQRLSYPDTPNTGPSGSGLRVISGAEWGDLCCTQSEDKQSASDCRAVNPAPLTSIKQTHMHKNMSWPDPRKGCHISSYFSSLSRILANRSLNHRLISALINPPILCHLKSPGFA